LHDSIDLLNQTGVKTSEISVNPMRNLLNIHWYPLLRFVIQGVWH